MNYMNEQRARFVKQCGALLRITKPNLIRCELLLGNDVTQSLPHGTFIAPNEEYVIVTAKNNHHYAICVEANSLHDIAWAIFDAMRFK